MFRPIKLVDLEVGGRLPDLSALDGLDGYGAVRALVRLHGTPLGFVTASTDAPGDSVRGAPAADVRESLVTGVVAQHGDALRRELVRHLLGEPAADAPCDGPLVSVAVCTRDRPEDLRRCLVALQRVEYRNFEVVVVDNAPSTDETERLVRTSFPDMRYVREPRPGLDWARNRALAVARGEVIAYTDDDVVVDGAWVSALARIFMESPDVGAVTGLVVPLEIETEAQSLFEDYGAFGRGFERSRHHVDRTAGERVAARYGATGKFGTGANMAFRRRALLRLGGFDPALDVGTATRGGGDLEMFFRVLKEGYTLVREPRAMVRHRHRRGYDELRAQLRTWGVGMYSYVTRSWIACPDERAGFAWIVARWLGVRNARRLLWSLFHDRYPRELLVDEFRGAPGAPWRYREARAVATAIEAEHGPIELPSAPPPGSAPGTGQRPKPRPKRKPKPEMARRTVDIAAEIAPIEALGAATTVSVEVCRRRHRLGRVELRPRGGTVAASELRDAIADRLAWPVLRTLEPGDLAACSHGSPILAQVLAGTDASGVAAEGRR